MSCTATANVITLRGSVDIVSEFFDFSVNSILYQRGLYPPESYKRVSKYALTMHMTQDEGLLAYMRNVRKQLDAWLLEGHVQQLVLVVKGLDSDEVLERWVFNVDCSATKENRNAVSTKSQAAIAQEIQAIVRQITASMTFLPLLGEPCSFDLLIYTDNNTIVPLMWEDSDPCIIENAEEVKFKSFSTNLHKVDVKVSYRVDDFAL